MNSSYRLNTLGPLCLWQCLWKDSKDRFVESLRSLVVEGHLTYPENGELCDCKEPGNSRHDVAKPEWDAKKISREDKERSLYLNLSMRRPKTRRDTKLAMPLPPENCTCFKAISNQDFCISSKLFFLLLKGKPPNNVYDFQLKNLQSRRQVCHLHWEWKPRFSSGWRRRCQWWGKTTWKNVNLKIWKRKKKKTI